MSGLVRLLDPLPTRSRSPAAIIGWWERRRLTFNLIVGAAGLLSIGVMNLILALPPLSRGPGVPFLPAVVFGVLANLCYSAGWGADRVQRLVAGGPARGRAGPSESIVRRPASRP